MVLVAGMGITVAAAGTIKQGSGGQHHMSHSQWHLDGRNCVTAKAGRIVTYGVHHAEPEGGDRTGILADAVDYTDGTGSCHISDGYCMNWSDADGDGVCDLCRNPAYCESGDGNGAQGSGNAVSQDSGSTAGSQGQNYGGYDLECYGTDYNGCGNSGRGHHSSGHHGRGHHR